MGLRLTTATALLMATTALVACDDDDEVGDAAVVDEVEIVDAEPDGDEVLVEEEPVIVTEDAPAAEPEPDPVIMTEDAAEPVEDGVVVVEAPVDAEPAEEEAVVLDETEEDLPASIAGVEEELDTDVGAAGAETLAEEPEIVVDEVDSAAVERVEEETEAEVLADGAIVQDAPVSEAAEGNELAGAPVDEDEAITLSNNVTVLDPEELSSTEDGTDAEAIVAPDASAQAQVEEIDDVATDGIDSLSELAMLDTDNVVMGPEQIQMLATLVEDSDSLSATQKITIVNGLDAARDDPQRLAQVLEQIVTLTDID
ncbi:hypothetical protein BCF33_0908 [Hasllibacter halocynthiae]|uniref:Uncharacterized protein n=2 Tax=Hasllibacter halocynthiae TaxID=595589 RepID=A0A2T0X8L4_9RHOB|nr:hypothetical protein BCF33_0908 [Hasllibacter halocynthiae]